MLQETTDLLAVKDRILISKRTGPFVVGSIGDGETLRDLPPERAVNCCDLIEIRLDSLVRGGTTPRAELWAGLAATPLLFTARRQEEGGSVKWNADQRSDALESVLSAASWIDIESASISEMTGAFSAIQERGIPWIASFHDFSGMPSDKSLREAMERARKAGASVFKWAAVVETPGDLARMAEFQLQDHGIPVASMGMGKLATVSRLLAAQCGSLLNYGYLGSQPTAPGQWHAGDLKAAIERLPELHS